MRAHLSALTSLWIATSILWLPTLSYIVQFNNGNSSPVLSFINIVAFVFYVQLFMQSFIANSRLKRIILLRQYLYSLLMILLASILLLPGIIVTVMTSSEIPSQISMIVMFGLQAIGSIWMWKVISSRNLITTQRPL